MAKENLSSKSEEQLKSLEKKVKNLEKILELQRRTIEHDKKFGKYEMM
tara:strand:- start:331 stop:474 length:144 start_codon:yes stop_codon:yes gene_type:complete